MKKGDVLVATVQQYHKNNRWTICNEHTIYSNKQSKTVKCKVEKKCGNSDKVKLQLSNIKLYGTLEDGRSGRRLTFLKSLVSVMCWLTWGILANLACNLRSRWSALNRSSSAPVSIARPVAWFSDAGVVAGKDNLTSSRIASVGANGWEWRDCSTRRASSAVGIDGADNSGWRRGRGGRQWPHPPLTAPPVSQRMWKSSQVVALA